MVSADVLFDGSGPGLADRLIHFRPLIRARRLVELDLPWGGDLAGRIAGGSTGSPMWVRIRSITGGSRMNAMIRMGSPHLGHCNGRHS